MGLLATLAAHDLGFIATDELLARIDADADQHRGARALRRPPAQLVRHANAGAAGAALRLDRRQRQPRRRAADAGGRAAPAAPARRSIGAGVRGHRRPRPRVLARGARIARRRVALQRTERLAPLAREAATIAAPGGRARRRRGDAGAASRRAWPRWRRRSRRSPRRIAGARGGRRPRTGRGGSRPRSPRIDAGRRTIDAARVERLASARGRVRRRDELPVPLRPAAPDPLDRLSPRRRRRARPARPVVLRPARLRSAAGQLHRASPRATCPRRTGSTSGGSSPAWTARPTLLSWSATLFEYLMPLLVMRSYPETLLDQTCRMVVRRQMDVRRRARRAVGHLGVGLQRRRPPRQLPVQGVRRPGPRPEARPRRRTGRRAVRDGAGRHARAGAGGREPPAARRGRAQRPVRLLRGHRLHAPDDRPAAGRRGLGRRARRAWSCGRSWRITRA